MNGSRVAWVVVVAAVGLTVGLWAARGAPQRGEPSASSPVEGTSGRGAPGDARARGRAAGGEEPGGGPAGDAGSGEDSAEPRTPAATGGGPPAAGPPDGRGAARHTRGASSTSADPTGVRIGAELVTDGLSWPVAVASAGDGSGRLFVVEKGGRIRVVEGGALQPEPFLDITDRVESQASERGLLGLAFHPRFRENGRLYVNYTTSRPPQGHEAGDSINSRFTAADGRTADAGSESLVLAYDQPFANHNGGDLQFGPDGMLYIGTGDGGSAGDPGNRAQRGDTLLGKLLRIDVDSAEPYAIPPDNPFVGEDEFRDEIWDYGLRNPWRFRFDRATGDLYIADVGQGAWEEVDFEPAGSRGGLNFGWRIMEGSRCYRADTCDTSGLVMPVAEYSHELGQSVTGGEVYRGSVVPRLVGLYVYADFGSGRAWALGRVGDEWRSVEAGRFDFAPSSFGLGEDGEIYVTAYGSRGALYRVVDAGSSPAPSATPGSDPGRTPPAPTVTPPGAGPTASAVPTAASPPTATTATTPGPTASAATPAATRGTPGGQEERPSYLPFGAAG